jgi:hypothetical protein
MDEVFIHVLRLKLIRGENHMTLWIVETDADDGDRVSFHVSKQAAEAEAKWMRDDYNGRKARVRSIEIDTADANQMARLLTKVFRRDAF